MKNSPMGTVEVKVERKSNKTMMLLSAIGILMMVDNHASEPVSLMTKVFPYNSFFMPLFIFISGYFFYYNKIEKNFLNTYSRR